MRAEINPQPCELESNDQIEDQLLEATRTLLGHISPAREQQQCLPRTDCAFALRHNTLTGADAISTGYNSAAKPASEIVGAARYAEAARLLDIAAADPDCSFATLLALSSIRLAQGDTERWLPAAQICIQRLDNAGLADCYGMLRQTQRMLANTNMTAEQRRQIESFRTRAQELCDDRFQNGDPRPQRKAR